MSQTIINGDSLKELQKIKENTIDAVITDPPYGIAFLGKDWDSFRGTKVARSQVVKNLGTGMRMTTHTENVNYQQWCEQWGRECLRVLKPGGYLLAFSAARLYHRITAGLEDAGFEIRDQIMWLYSSGFPKAQDIGKAIQKRQGVEKYNEIDLDAVTECAGRTGSGGGINRMMKRLDAKGDQQDGVIKQVIATSPEAQQWSGWKTALKPAHEPICMARKPFKGSAIDNVLTHGVGALNIDATRIPTDDIRSGGANGVSRLTFGEGETSNTDSFRQYTPNKQGRFPSNVLGEVKGYQKFFYCPKVSRGERHRGFEQTKIPTNPEGMLDRNGGTRYVDGGNKQHNAGNNHPTVKPVELMKYLIRLVTPAEAHIIDPFAGSGTTGMACRELNRRFTGIELDPNYCAIAEQRIAATQEDKAETLFT